MYDCFYCYRNNTNHTLTSKQSNKHILIVVKMSSISANNIGSAAEIESGSKDTYTHKDCVRLKRAFYVSKYIPIA